MKNQKKAYFFALCAVALWSTVATAFKIALEHTDVAGLLLISSFVSMLSLLVVVLANKNFPILLGLSRKQIFKSSLLGFLNPFAYYLVLFKAYSLLPAQEALALNYTWAVVVVLLSIPLLKQKIRLINIGALMISFAGVVVIAARGDIFGFRFEEPLGTTLAAGSSIIWAGYWVFNAMDKTPPEVKLFLNFLFGWVYILIYSLISSGSADFIISLNFKAIMAGAYVGFFEMGFTFILWMKAMENTTTTAKIGNLIYLSPVLSLIFIGAVLGEQIMPATVFGLALILGGIVIQGKIKSGNLK